MKCLACVVFVALACVLTSQAQKTKAKQLKFDDVKSILDKAGDKPAKLDGATVRLVGFLSSVKADEKNDRFIYTMSVHGTTKNEVTAKRVLSKPVQFTLAKDSPKLREAFKTLSANRSRNRDNSGLAVEITGTLAEVLKITTESVRLASADGRRSETIPGDERMVVSIENATLGRMAVAEQPTNQNINRK